MTTAEGKWLRWGILGTGRIARTFAEGIAASESGTLIAVGSRAQETADRFADTYGVERRYASYEALLADPDVQAVYISLPNHLHAEWTIKCAQAGKHILCEKPLTTNYGEAMTVVEEVRRCGVFLMEAFMYRCHPQTARLKQLLDEGVIGEVRLIQSAFRFPGGIVASLVCGTQVHVDGDLRIWGSDGSIQVPNPWFPGKGANRILIHKDGEAGPREILVEGPGELYAIEADTVARHIAERQAPSPGMTWADSLGNMKTLDAWRRAVGLTFDVEKPEALRRPAPARRSDAPMTYGHIPGIDKPVARLIMGSIALTSRDMPFTCAMLDYYVSLGGNAVDTAYHYGEEVERAIGQWMQLRGNRDQTVIVGKGAHHGPRGPRVNRDAIASDLAASLERLQTDYIDLYLLHRDDAAVPVGEIVEWLNEHYQAGRIRAFGESNWTTGRLQAAIDYAREHELVPFVASSPNFSLAVWNEPPWKDCLSAAVEGKEWYNERQFPLLAWSSQAQGFFTGRYSPEDRSNPNMVRTWYNEANFERLERARELGRRKGVSANAIALAYVLCQPFPTFALIGPHTLEELRTSCEALRVSLTPEELRWLNLP